MKWRSLPLLLILLAFGLRVWGLAEHNLWWDEGIGVWLARMPALESVRWTAGDVHPPLYYLALRGWWLMVGEGEFVLRFPSALFSLLTVPLIYRLGKELGRGSESARERVGLLAALFLTLSRFAVAWAQEIRMYALAALMGTGALWAAVRLWKQPQSRRAWLTYVVATLGSLYSLYLTVTVPLVANLGFLAAWWKAYQRMERKGWKPIAEAARAVGLYAWLTAQAAVALLFLPWIAYALPRMHSWSSESAFTPGFFAQLYGTMLVVGSPLNLEAYLPLTVAVFVMLALGLGLLLRTRLTPAQSGGLAMLLAGLALPAVVVFVVSLPALRFTFSRPLVPRYLLPLSACFYALLAWGIVAPAQARPGDRPERERRLSWGRWAAGGAAALVVVAALSGLRSFYPGRARRDDYTSIGKVLDAHRRPGDAVLLYVDRDWPIFVAHYAGERASVPYGATPDATSAEALLAPIWHSAEGVWLVTTPEALQTDPQQMIPRWLADHALSWRTWVEGENSLAFYARTETRQAGFDELSPGFAPPANVEADVGDGRLLGAATPLPRYRTGDTVHLSLYWSPPPSMEVTVELAGPEAREIAAGAPAPVPHGATRQQVDIPLPPDLPGGRYQLHVRAGADAVTVDRFTLVRKAAGADISRADIPHPVDYRLGEAIRLIGYDLPRTTIEPGGVVELTLYWQAQSALPERYKVFTHLLGDVYNAANDNFLWGQQDNEPGSGQALTTLWTPGAVIVDSYRIPVDPAAPPGIYRIEIGMYGLVDVARLPVFGSDGQPLGDAILLEQVEMREP